MKEKALKLADELEALHQYVPSEAPAMIRRLVEELDKQSEPVAWIIQSKYGTPQLNWDARYRVRYDSTVVKQASIPLYTTPQTKPLSDEEIWELHQEHIDEIPCGHSMKTIGFVEFARAIEERHGIK